MKLAVLILWLLLGLYFGTGGITKMENYNLIKSTLNQSDTVSVTYKNVPFQNKGALLQKLEQDEIDSLFPWIDSLPSYVSYIITACAFGLLGTLINLFIRLALQGQPLSGLPVYTLPVLGMLTGLVVLGISLVLTFNQVLSFFLGLGCLFVASCNNSGSDEATQERWLDQIKNVIWRNQASSHAGLATFYITETGDAEIRYYDSSGQLQTHLLSFDHYLSTLSEVNEPRVPIFKRCENGKCAWLAVSTRADTTLAGNFYLADSSFDYDNALLHDPYFFNNLAGGAGESKHAGQYLLLTSVSCCINKDHMQHHCGKTMDELANLHKKYGCVFD